jgi:DnaJ family protein B protein 12
MEEVTEASASARQCLDIAATAWASGDKEKALKFVNTSLRLYPTPQAEQLLATYTRTIPSPAAARPSPAPRPELAPKDYTDEQSNLALQVTRNKSDFYAVLGVSRDANEKDIKSAYRKVACFCVRVCVYACAYGSVRMLFVVA